jgi:hypothetical protein
VLNREHRLHPFGYIVYTLPWKFSSVNRADALANTSPVNDEKGIYNAGDSAWGRPAGIVSALRHQRALWLQVAQSLSGEGFAGLEQKSRRPRSHPDEIGTKMQAPILSLRDKRGVLYEYATLADHL